MRAAVSWRGKALIAFIAIFVLLLVVLLSNNAANDGASSASPQAGAAAKIGTAPSHVTSPSAYEAGRDIASNLRVDAQAPVSSGSAREGGAVGAAGAERVATLPADTVVDNRNPRTRRYRVSAECWGLRGSAPKDFVVTLDREVRTSGEASALIASLRNTAGYATMFQTSAAGPVRGKRVEFSADIRTRGSKGGANLLLRAEDAGGRTVAFDNMVQSFGVDRRPDQLINRGVMGDSEWSTQHVVVDIPDEAQVITYGVSFFGGGKAWIDNARIEVVHNEMATTAIDVHQSPTPLNGIPIDPASLSRNPRNLEFDSEAKSGALPCN